MIVYKPRRTFKRDSLNCMTITVRNEVVASSFGSLMNYLKDIESSIFSVTSMLVTDVGDQICWCRVWDAGDKSRHQYQE